MTDYWNSVIKSTAAVLLPILEDWYGSRVALRRNDLCQQLSCTDSVLRSAIGQLRREGHLIIACNGGGYRLAQSETEVEQYVQTLQDQVQALQETITAMEGSLAQRRYSSQLEMIL